MSNHHILEIDKIDRIFWPAKTPSMYESIKMLKSISNNTKNFTMKIANNPDNIFPELEQTLTELESILDHYQRFVSWGEARWRHDRETGGALFNLALQVNNLSEELKSSTLRAVGIALSKVSSEDLEKNIDASENLSSIKLILMKLQDKWQNSQVGKKFEILDKINLRDSGNVYHRYRNSKEIYCDVPNELLKIEPPDGTTRLGLYDMIAQAKINPSVKSVVAIHNIQLQFLKNHYGLKESYYQMYLAHDDKIDEMAEILNTTKEQALLIYNGLPESANKLAQLMDEKLNPVLRQANDLKLEMFGCTENRKTIEAALNVQLSQTLALDKENMRQLMSKLLGIFMDDDNPKLADAKKTFYDQSDFTYKENKSPATTRPTKNVMPVIFASIKGDKTPIRIASSIGHENGHNADFISHTYKKPFGHIAARVGQTLELPALLYQEVFNDLLLHEKLHSAEKQIPLAIATDNMVASGIYITRVLKAFRTGMDCFSGEKTFFPGLMDNIKKHYSQSNSKYIEAPPDMEYLTMNLNDIVKPGADFKYAIGCVCALVLNAQRKHGKASMNDFECLIKTSPEFKEKVAKILNGGDGIGVKEVMEICGIDTVEEFVEIATIELENRLSLIKELQAELGPEAVANITEFFKDSNQGASSAKKC